MTTITINKRTKAGKLLFEMAKLLSEKEKGVLISEDEKPRYNEETENAIRDVREGKAKLIKADSVEELLKKLRD
ncbi:MAG TPA: hypothetical protein DD740_04835 [Chryseobacterium sp.]|nr:hypothetical protein [Chryseobacterium sp.]